MSPCPAIQQSFLVHFAPSKSDRTSMSESWKGVLNQNKLMIYSYCNFVIRKSNHCGNWQRKVLFAKTTEKIQKRKSQLSSKYSGRAPKTELLMAFRSKVGKLAFSMKCWTESGATISIPNDNGVLLATRKMAVGNLPRNLWKCRGWLNWTELNWTICVYVHFMSYLNMSCFATCIVSILQPFHVLWAKSRADQDIKGGLPKLPAVWFFLLWIQNIHRKYKSKKLSQNFTHGCFRK